MFYYSVFFNSKLSKSFLCICFDIYFKINLVLPLGFKVMNDKNLYLKHVFVFLLSNLFGKI